MWQNREAHGNSRLRKGLRATEKRDPNAVQYMALFYPRENNDDNLTPSLIVKIKEYVAFSF